MVSLTKTVISAGAGSIPWQLVRSSCAPVLTYHACFRSLPPGVAPVDSITPEALYEQLSVLKKHFRIVTIDEFSQITAPRGIAAVTFDDGYKGVIEEALPVFVSLDVPVTIFVNTRSFEHKIFWRHKVVFIQQQGLVADCEAGFQAVRAVAGQDFYTYLKHPSNNSKRVEEELDTFLQMKALSPGDCNYVFDSPAYLIKHPLIWYGNHTHSHYVMSSLSFTEQLEEVRAAKAYLQEQQGIQVSGVFSLPFGGTHHINRVTFTVLRELEYKTLAMNRGRVNIRLSNNYGIRIIERFSPVPQTLQLQIKKRFGATVIRDHYGD